jgi:hypothetical protein
MPGRKPGRHRQGRNASTDWSSVDDEQIHGRIEQLVAEEHELWQREAEGGASEGDRRRLDALKVTLDQC